MAKTNKKLLNYLSDIKEIKSILIQDDNITCICDLKFKPTQIETIRKATQKTPQVALKDKQYFLKFSRWNTVKRRN